MGPISGPDLIPPLVRAWVYILAVIVTAGLALCSGLHIITVEAQAAGLQALGILTAGLAIGYLPTSRPPSA